jgi:hypothetical protein
MTQVKKARIGCLHKMCKISSKIQNTRLKFLIDSSLFFSKIIVKVESSKKGGERGDQ